MLESLLLFTGCSSIQCFNSPSFPEHIQDKFSTVLLPVKCLCNFLDAMPRYLSPSTSHPVLPREAEDFPRVGKNPKDVPLPTFLAYLQPV